MSGETLAGVVGAWSVAHVALGGFFLLAFALGRREREFLLFSLLCFALSVSSAGIGLDYLGADEFDDRFTDQLVHGGAIVAAALNVHFAMEFARVQRATRIAVVLYGIVIIFEVATFRGLLWYGHSPVAIESFGSEVAFTVGNPTPLGYLFYAVAVAESVAAATLLLAAYRSGRREALSALVGFGLCLPAVVNDAGIAVGLVRSTVSLLPHGFLVYAFGVGATLLLRYRSATVELEFAAKDLARRTHELEHSHAELRLVQDELTNKRQLAAVGELAAAIAHEVRNPLAVIVNAVAGLRRGNLREEARVNLLDIVDEEAARLNRLVGDLLRFARPVSVNRLPVSMVDVANRARASLPDGYELVVDSDAAAENEIVYVDPNLFKLVLENLIANACQAMRDGGVVTVRVRSDATGPERAVVLEVTDRGRGMDSDVKRRATDPFFTTRPSGTGLGLSIVLRIIEAHQGALAIESSQGSGTTVRVRVPVGKPPAESEAPILRALP